MRIHAAVTRSPHQTASIEELEPDEPRDDEILSVTGTIALLGRAPAALPPSANEEKSFT